MVNSLHRVVRWFLVPFLILTSVRPAFAEDNKLVEMAQQLQAAIVKTLDYAEGKGTGEMARRLRALATEFADEASAVRAQDFKEAGLTFQNLRSLILAAHPDGMVLTVMNYQRAVAHAQLRLQRAGIDFIKLQQHPAAALSEMVREYSSRLATTPVKVEELKALSKLLYVGEADNVITLPLHDAEVAAANAALVRRGETAISFVKDANVMSADDVMLPPFGEPLKDSKAGKARLERIRQWIGPPLALFGTAFGGGFAAPGIAAGVVAAGLERQFVTFSHQWAKFWDRFGFGGNIAVNAAYGVILTSTIMATEAALQMNSSVNLKDFFVKSLAIGTTTFVASFGAMQIASSRLQHAGEFTEAGRFKLETYSVLWNNFGRVLALGAAGLGLQYQLGQVYGVNFGMGELIGWGIQAAYFAAITAPMWMKAWWGDKNYDLITKEYFDKADGRLPAEGLGWWGRFKNTCSRAIANMSDWYTFTRK